MPTHLVTVRNDLKRLLKSNNPVSKKMSILDVGGRKSPYTINLSAEITLLDVPQEEGTREALNLGFTSEILKTIQKKRSNIKDVVIQDMTKSALQDGTFDAVVCVEVIEHVEEDDDFVKNISKVIKKGGWAYFTTPNGDYIKNEGPDKNPDHVRHYTKAQLQSLLEQYFENVDVHYAVKTGKYRVWSLKSLKTKNLMHIIKSLVGTLKNRYESRGREAQPQETAHLISVAVK
jgi:2-polyprenyl-3-methyl-5-hydroxy-6-metoxy-1,4-benzoquinol methylase